MPTVTRIRRDALLRAGFKRVAGESASADEAAADAEEALVGVVAAFVAGGSVGN
jgi:hypothetical protein